MSTRNPWLPTLEGQATLLIIRRHRLILCGALAVRGLAAAALLVLLGSVGVAGTSTITVVGAMAAATAAWSWFSWRADSFQLSPRTLTFRSGLLVRRCRVVPVEAVQDGTTQQSFVGLVLGYGTVEVHLRSGSLERLVAVPAPQAVRDRIVRSYLEALGGMPTWAR
jgi:membrane protein YdbS with pleckstrin-like domain